MIFFHACTFAFGLEGIWKQNCTAGTKNHKPPLDWCFQSTEKYHFQWGLAKWNWDQCWYQGTKEVVGCLAQLQFSLPVHYGCLSGCIVQPAVQDPPRLSKESSLGLTLAGSYVSLLCWGLSTTLMNYVLNLVLQCKETLLKGHFTYGESDKGFPLLTVSRGRI